MRPRPRSVAVALAAAIAWPLAGCGAAAWPAVEGVADPRFASGERAIATIDLLPSDIQVWCQDGRDPFAVAAGLDEMAASMVAEELGQRGYRLGARLDATGGFVTADGTIAPAMSEEELGATLYALSSYGSAQAAQRGELLVPYLPHRLGEATAGDATLYVGGWAFAGAPPRKGGGTGTKVLKGVAVGLLAVVLVVVVIAAIKGDSGGGGLGQVASGVGRAAAGTARVAGTVVRTAGRVAIEAGRFGLRGAYAVGRSGSAIDMLDAAEAVIQASGQEVAARPTHIEVVADRPDWYARPGAPRAGRSRMLIEMTLIDNSTGVALWHARRELSADPTRPRDVARAMRHMLASLPAR
jgi:hypothetical protein